MNEAVVGTLSTDLKYNARGFGLTWAADVPLTYFDEAPPKAACDVAVRRVETLPQRGPSRPAIQGEIFDDGFRLNWDRAAIFDVHGAARVDYLVQAGWAGKLPNSLYSTIAALLLAGRGILPLHATALELDGRAFLLSGPSGAGKSTLAAELLSVGMRLVGDDLSAAEPPGKSGERFMVRRGRPAMRLHPSTANAIEGECRADEQDDPRGKVLVRPAQRTRAESLPLEAIIVLEEGRAPGAAEAAALLPGLLFRPRWFAAMPGHPERLALLLELARAVPVYRLPPVRGFEAAQRHQRIADVLNLLKAR